MKINRLLATAMTAAALWTALPARAQQSNLTRESVLAMSIEQLSDLPMEDLSAPPNCSTSRASTNSSRC